MNNNLIIGFIFFSTLALMGCNEEKTSSSELCADFIAKKEYSKAILCLKKNKKIPGDSNLLRIMDIANCYMKLEEIDSAVYYLKLRKKLYPQYTTANQLENIQELYISKTELDSMKKYSLLALSLDSNLYTSNFNLGYYYYNKRKFRKGLPHIEKALLQKTNSLPLLNMLADSFYYLEYFDSALEIYIVLNEGDKTTENCYLNQIGRCYNKLGELKKAIKYFKESLNSCEIEKQDVINDLIRIYSSINNMDSVNYYKKVVIAPN